MTIEKHLTVYKVQWKHSQLMFLSSCYLTSDLYWEKDTVKHEAPTEPSHRLWQEVFSLPRPMLTLGFGSPSRSGMTTLLSCRHPSSLCRNPELSSGFPHYLLSPLHQPGPEASIFYLLFLKLSSYINPWWQSQRNLKFPGKQKVHSWQWMAYS